MPSKLGLAAVALLAVGCTRDLTLPPPPGPLQPGTLSGRVVFAEVGSNLRKPAAGAGVELLTTSISAIADADGRFTLTGITQRDGALLIRFGLKPDGTFARQRLLRLEEIGAGPGHDISLGEIAVVENAQIRGTVLRGNIVTLGGHGGTTVFVPEGPFATTTADDGSFLLPALPEGSLRLVFFRPGYRAVSLDEVGLRSGEELTVRLVTLEVDPTPQTPARVAGTVSTNPPLADLSGGSIELTAPGDPPLVAALASNGSFELASVPPGIYTIAAKHPQYTTATLHNFLAASGGSYTLAQIVLTTAPLPPQPDAGAQPQTGDGGTPDGGNNVNANLPPIASAGVDQVVRTGATVQLNATLCVDPENRPLRYSWVELSDAGVTLSSNNSLLAMTPTFTAPSAPKLLRFQLTVTDDGDLSASDEVIVEAMRPPKAIIDPPAVTVPAGQAITLTFDGGQSFDPNSAPLTYSWSIGPGLSLTPASGTGKAFTVTTPSSGAGAATVRLVVSNGYLSSDPAEARVTIGGGVPSLTVNAGTDLTVGFGVALSLQATASSNMPSSTFNYSWTQIAGGSVSLTGAATDTVSFIAPSTADTLTFRVNATGSFNETGYDEVTITVKDTTAPTIVNTVPGNGGIGSPLFASVSFNEDLLPSTVTASNVRVVDASNNAVQASVVYDAAADKATISYGSPLTTNGSYTLKVDNVTDLAGNAVASFSAPFTARNFLFPLWEEASSASAATLSTLPYVLWTPSGTYVVGRRQVSPLPSYAAYFHVWKVSATSAFLDTPSYITTNQPQEDVRSGDMAPRAFRTGMGWYALAGVGNGFGGYYLQLYNTVGDVFTTTAGWPGSTALSDGANIWSTYENYGLNVRAHIPSQNTFGPEQKIDANCCRTGRIMGAGDGTNFYVASWANGITPTTYNRKSWIFKNTGGSFIKFGEAGTGAPTDVLQGRMRVHNGLPVVVQPESVGGNYQLRAYAWSGTAMTEVGGGPLNATGSVTSFDAAILADTLYVAFLSGNDVRVKYASLTATGAGWTELTGPNSGGTFNQTVGCAADRPSMDAAPDGLWLAWSESCGGTTSWKTFVRKLH